jgi:chromate transporter
MGSYHHFNNSLLAGSIGLLVTVFYTFLPSFAFILLGAPVIERTQENKSIRKVLAFVTAAVVGVIANLTIFTANAVLFPTTTSIAAINWLALLWIIISIVAMKKFKANMILWIGISAGMGLISKMLLSL